MKASQLIEVLQGILEDHGDISVRVGDEPQSKPVTGLWVKQHPKSHERVVALSTGGSI